MANGYMSAAAAVLATVCCVFSYAGQVNPIAGFAFPSLLLLATRSSTKRNGMVLALLCLLIGINIAYFDAVRAADDILLQIAGLSALAAVMSVPYVLDRLLYDRMCEWQKILFFPFLMASFEVIQTLTPIGNCNSLAYSQTGFLESMQMVSVIGSTGLTFMICLFASASSHLALKRVSEGTIDRKAAVCILVVVIAVFAGSVRLATEAPSGETVTVLCTEGPEVYVYWETATVLSYEENAEYLDRAVDAAHEAGVAILSTSEDAFCLDVSDEDRFTKHVEERAAETGLYIIYGLVIMEKGEQIWNLCVFVNPSGVTEWKYAKVHLVPVNEYCRYVGDGTIYCSETEFGNISALICMDLEFPAYTSRISDSTDLLVSPSFDWPGLEVWHTRNMALRAVENGASLLRNTGYGTIGVYDYLGHEIRQETYRGDAQDFYMMEVPIEGKETVFGAYGAIIVWIYVLGLFLVLIPSAIDVYQKRKVAE